MSALGRPEREQAPERASAKGSPMSKFHPLAVAKVERETRDAIAVTFEVPEKLRGGRTSRCAKARRSTSCRRWGISA
jgi:hypothetical protein